MTEEVKTCSRCKETLPFSAFSYHPNGLFKLKSRCRQCASEYDRNNYQKRKDQKLKIASEWNKANRERHNEHERRYRKRHSELRKIKNSLVLSLEDKALMIEEYWANFDISDSRIVRDRIPTEEYINTLRARRQERIRIDPLYRLKIILRSRLCKFISSNKTKSSIEGLGCSLHELKTYLESLFQPGMTWDNWSYSGWHIDHIVPLSQGQSESEIIRLQHYTNLRPMWASENISKSDSKTADGEALCLILLNRPWVDV